MAGKPVYSVCLLYTVLRGLVHIGARDAPNAAGRPFRVNFYSQFSSKKQMNRAALAGQPKANTRKTSTSNQLPQNEENPPGAHKQKGRSTRRRNRRLLPPKKMRLSVAYVASTRKKKMSSET
jgi:hypothetical protein